MKKRRLTFPERHNPDNSKYAQEGAGYLPNPRGRYCTEVLKITGASEFMKKKKIDVYNRILGLRYDEPRRVSNIKKKITKKVDVITPMYNAEHTKDDVRKFWKDYWFDLNLPDKDIFSNCDLCFLKGREKTDIIIRQKPERADWWIRMEEENKNVFRRDRPSYKKLKEIIEISPMLFDDENDDGDLGDCFCTD